jgi:hypothetical protein
MLPDPSLYSVLNLAKHLDVLNATVIIDGSKSSTRSGASEATSLDFDLDVN